MDTTRDFRDALARYPTGVAIVTVTAGDRAGAMTINSFASVSLEPPLVLWSLALGSDRKALFQGAERYAINVLAADQQELASACARQNDVEAGGGRWTHAPGGGAPFIDGAVARFDCALRAVHRGGDHDIIVGEVVHFDRPVDKPALVFHRSAYAEL